jgi:hypothetical protein
MSYLIGLSILLIAFVTLWPRGLLAQISAGELRVLKVFLVARLVSPFAFEFIGNNAGRFFTGGWDSKRYENRGGLIAEQLSTIGYSTAHAEVPGTGALELMVGYFFFLSGDVSRLSAVLLWSWLAALGLILFWWFTRPYITARRDLYAAFALLAPTLVFWNSSLGKEAPLTLGIGCLVAALSILTVKGSLLRAVLYLSIGVLLTGSIRPHITLMFFLAVLTAGVISRSGRVARLPRRKGARFLVTVMAISGVAIALPLSSQLLGAGEDRSLVDAAYDFADQGPAGRSAFEARAPRTPLEVPGAVVTTLFRPFPFEAQTAFQMAASLEGLFFAFLGFRAIRELLARRARLEINLMVAASLVYVAVFSSAVVGYGNFGLLVRQKMQVWSFVIFLIFAVTPVAVQQIRRQTLQAAGTGQVRY